MALPEDDNEDTEQPGGSIKPDGGGTSAVEDIEADNGPVEYFNLMGIKITEPQPGEIVIERRGSKVSKKIYY